MYVVSNFWQWRNSSIWCVRQIETRKWGCNFVAVGCT
jgi:hypothetical protein